METRLDLDIWSHAIPGRPGTILVAVDKIAQFENELNAIGAEFKVETENIKE